ncbi:DUF389 domain-containing protein [Cumulibacter manganitolerans]|uniref:DUF389 domain-containing protein n=1 Tax=Cumulibacter manganitolerans TaxID=1884992 RepID=UPI0012955D2F|nr:DUF389 domain-containing protein [Cumulibacter manganitolerans]
MLSLRISAPASLSDQVVTLLRDAPYVTGLSIVRGASLVPVGDVITADVAREGANAVIDQLHRLGVHRDGAIRLDPVATWLSLPALEAERAAPGASADAVVWTEVGNRAYQDSELNWTYLSFMVLATLLAGVAIVLDSPILTVGAMVLGPEFGPIAAIGLALVRRRPHLLRLATTTLVLGFAAGIACTSLAALLGRAIGWVSLSDILHRTQTEFIYSPDRWSVVVATVAAAAGVLSLTSSRTGGLAGVFISVTTVPAAGNLGMALAFGAWNELRGSALQLSLNLACMAAAGAGTLALQNLIWGRLTVRRKTLIGRPDWDRTAPVDRAAERARREPNR